jgi:hypothetical protein
MRWVGRVDVFVERFRDRRHCTLPERTGVSINGGKVSSTVNRKPAASNANCWKLKAACKSFVRRFNVGNAFISDIGNPFAIVGEVPITADTDRLPHRLSDTEAL